MPSNIYSIHTKQGTYNRYTSKCTVHIQKHHTLYNNKYIIRKKVKIKAEKCCMLWAKTLKPQTNSKNNNIWQIRVAWNKEGDVWYTIPTEEKTKPHKVKIKTTQWDVWSRKH